MPRSSLRVACCVWLLASCPLSRWRDPPAVALDQFIAEHEAWRQERRERLVTGSGPVVLVGLWQLEEGTASIGGDAASDIVLPASKAPPWVGTLQRRGHEVRFAPALGVAVKLGDSIPVTLPLTLASDVSGAPTDLGLKSLRFRLHGEPGTDRLWIRAWDEEHPARLTFALPQELPLDTAWRLAARFRPYFRPRASPVIDVTGGPQAYAAPGELVFRVGEREFTLVAFADSSSRDFLVMFADSTNASATYPAGRYMRVAFPGKDGWTILDFNRAYSPPCAFTPYSTCALPPEENRLALTIPVGERRVH